MSELDEDKRTFPVKCLDITHNWLWWAVFAVARKNDANVDLAEARANKAVKAIR